MIGNQHMIRSIVFTSMAAFTLLTAGVYGGTQNGADQTSISNQPTPEGTLGKYVGKDGAITLPEDYRLKWIHLGSWYIEDKKGGPGEVRPVPHFVQPAPRVVLPAVLQVNPSEIHGRHCACFLSACRMAGQMLPHSPATSEVHSM